MKTFVIGDIHGAYKAYKALKQCLKRSNFDYENDVLITLGDIVDGQHEVYECVEELLKIKNRIDIKGNHDDWFNEFCMYSVHPVDFHHRGDGTRDSYNKHFGIHNVPESHKKFFAGQHLYYEDDKNRFFVHGGYNYEEGLLSTLKHEFYWDRDMWYEANNRRINNYESDLGYYDEIFIGHTATERFSLEPVKSCNVWNLDQGAGWSGKLTIMNVDTHEYFQSDLVKELYPNIKGR